MLTTLKRKRKFKIREVKINNISYAGFNLKLL